MQTYVSAWKMLRTIRSAMGKEEYKDTFEAVVEIDETYVGGKPRKDNAITRQKPMRNTISADVVHLKRP